MSYACASKKQAKSRRRVMSSTRRCALFKRYLTDVTSCQAPMEHVRRRLQQVLQALCMEFAHQQQCCVHQAATPMHSTHWHSAHSWLPSRPNYCVQITLVIRLFTLYRVPESFFFQTAGGNKVSYFPNDHLTLSASRSTSDAIHGGENSTNACTLFECCISASGVQLQNWVRHIQ
jgi:hypothetical protein